MAAGDWVMAIGNPFSHGWTVTVGVISATERAVPVTDGRTSEMLQTDAAINPGNSGGPLLNLRGEVIGMNTTIISNGRAEGNIGIGFAVPINTVRDLLPQLHTGKVIRGRIGVQMTAVPRDGFEDFGLKSRSGALVSQRAAGRRRAEKAGIEAGRRHRRVQRPAGDQHDELQKMVTATKPGTSVPVKVMREQEGADAERHGRRARSRRRTDRSRSRGTTQRDAAGRAGRRQLRARRSSNLTPQMARRLQMPSGQSGAVITEVDPERSVGRRAAAGRRHPGGQRHAGVERRRSGARAAARRRRAASRRSSCGA